MFDDLAEIGSTQQWPRTYSEMKSPLGGFIMPHTAHSWILLWAALWTDKSLSTWCPRVVPTLVASHPEKGPPLWDTRGGRDPASLSQKEEASAALWVVVRQGLPPGCPYERALMGICFFVCRQKETVKQPEREEHSRYGPFKLSQLTHTAVHL